MDRGLKHNYLSNTPLEVALSEYLKAISDSGFKAESEIIPTAEAYGRVTASAVYAKICSPHYNASAMDGIAVSAKMTYGASEQSPIILPVDAYTVVDTGDAMPSGTDAVIMAEDVIDLEDGSVKIISALSPWQNVRQVGEDICMGDMIAPSYTKITPMLCGAFIAGGIINVEVLKTPTVGIIPTGDELVLPTDNPKEGDILEFNSVIFSGMLKEYDCGSKCYPIVPDKKEQIELAVKKAVDECDMVIISAGSSAGRDDYTAEIIKNLGTMLFHGLAVKPGKPAILGMSKGKPVFGLPGYPVSAAVIMREIVRPVIDLYYHRATDNNCVNATLGKKTVSSLKYAEKLRVSLGYCGDTLTAVPLAKGAGVVTSLTKAAGILTVPQNLEGIEAGERVNVKLIKNLGDIKNSLVITGSHDPLIDEVADLLRINNTHINIASSHVGSMGAISAIKAGAAHLGGIHLMDTETGEYNKSYIEKHFPNGGVKIIKGVGRVQGLMVKKGNPLNILEFADIKNYRYVNRQRGAGTRILCDYLLKKNNISPNEIEGYKNEEFTHTAVAALIASGNGDCGLGIYSAAKTYDLDFIPICNEEYDFLVSDAAWEMPMVQEFFKILFSEEMAKRLNDLGGYSIRQR